MMMQKYAHAKKMYAEHSHLPKYPAQDRYGGHMIEYGGLSFKYDTLIEAKAVVKQLDQILKVVKL